MCAIFGLIDYKKIFTPKQRNSILRVLATECEERGTDATGFAFNKNDHLTVYKRPYPAHIMNLQLPDEANIILGHTRMATQGKKEYNYNNHPFLGRAGTTPFALAHNGVLYNDEFLRDELNLPDTIIKTDSYIAVQLIEQRGSLSLEALAGCVEKIMGSFVFTILDRCNNSYFIKGNNPLALYHFKSLGFYIYASTEAILNSAIRKMGLKKYNYKSVKSKPGDIIKINAKGEIEKGTFDILKCEECDYYGLYPYYGHCYNVKEPLVIRELKSVAQGFGYSEYDIEMLLDFGYTVDEVSEMLYDTDMFEETLMDVLMFYDEECCYGKKK